MDPEARRSIAATLLVFIALCIVYAAYTGPLLLDDYVYMVITLLPLSYVFSWFFLRGPVSEVLNPKKIALFIWYCIYYMTYCEYSAHKPVIEMILGLRSIRPGIVRVPYKCRSDWGITIGANSITNTPGTVTVDIDEERKVMYVHWIEVAGEDPETCYSNILEPFEKYLIKIFG